MPKLLLAVLCWLLAGSAFAQKDTPSVITPVNEWYLKINPLAVFEIEGGIGFSGEYLFVKTKLGIQLEIQPVLFSLYKNYEVEEPINTIASGAPLGIELRPEIRYYFDGLHARKYHRRRVLRADGTELPRKNERRAYAAVDLLYKYVQRERLGELNVNNGGTAPPFRQRAVYTDVKKMTGFDVKIGAVSSISQSNRWLIEVFIGFGFRHKKFSYKDLPVGVSEPLRRNSINLFGVRNAPTTVITERNASSLPAGIKLVYRL